MILTEIHQINKSNKNWKSCDNLCFLSKNLYNQALWAFNEEYKKSNHFIRYKDMEKLMKEQPDHYNNYKLLTSSVSQQVLMLFDKNIKSFLGLVKLWKKDKAKLNGCPKFLKYKPKDGRNAVIIRGDKFVCKFKNGFIHFPKRLNLTPIKSINISKQEDLVQVRIVPQSSCYKIELIYNKVVEINLNTGKASIDLGVNNLASLYIDNGNTYLVNGKDVKSINKYYNKLKANKQSKLIKCQQKYNSHGLINLAKNRNNKINDLLHKKSKKIVEKLKENKVKDLVIGYNKEWKKSINLGKKTNQTFVSIPYHRFIEMLKYKCALQGINVIINEESYTSKCSSLDLESVKKHDNYLGKRVKRGLFKSGSGKLINADVNGSLNIGRKVFGDGFIPADIGLVLNPIKI